MLNLYKMNLVRVVKSEINLDCLLQLFDRNENESGRWDFKEPIFNAVGSVNLDEKSFLRQKEVCDNAGCCVFLLCFGFHGDECHAVAAFDVRNGVLETCAWLQAVCA